MDVKFVVFSGTKGSGKDTCAKILVDKKKIHKRTLSFAGPLKAICSEVFDLHINMFNDPVLKEKELKDPITLNVKQLRKIKDLMVTYIDPYYDVYYNLNKATTKLVGTHFSTPRKILQVIGTDFIRDEIFKEWHCRAAFSEKNIKNVLGNAKSGVIAVTDCRFPNEYDFVYENFPESSFYFVQRDEVEATSGEQSHSSETEILEVKNKILENGGVLISNNGTLEELQKTVAKLKLPTVEKKKGAKKLSLEEKVKWTRKSS